VLGGLCGFGGFPGIIQLFLLIVGAGIFTAVVFVPLWWLLDEARPARDIVSRTARDMMRFVTIRPLMAGYGVVLALLLVFGLLVQRVPPPLFLLGFSSAVICFWCAASPEFTPTPPAPPPSQQRSRDASGSAFLRDSPPAP
jgi:fatty acid desaturase